MKALRKLDIMLVKENFMVISVLCNISSIIYTKKLQKFQKLQKYSKSVYFEYFRTLQKYVLIEIGIENQKLNSALEEVCGLFHSFDRKY